MTPDRIAVIPQFGRTPDCETYLIQPTLLAPDLVCMSLADARCEGVLLGKHDALDVIWALLNDDRIIWINTNIAFDFLVLAVAFQRWRQLDVMPHIFKAYNEGRVFCLTVAQNLDAIAKGYQGKMPDGSKIYDKTGKLRERYSQETMVKINLGRDDAKANDAYRLLYGTLDDTPIESWPLEARQYPVDDCNLAMRTALAMCGLAPGNYQHVVDYSGVGPDYHCTLCGISERLGHEVCPAPRPIDNLHEVAIQSYKAWALHLGCAWGLVTDPVRVAALKAAAMEGRVSGAPEFIELGILRPNGSEVQSEVKRRVAIAYGAKGYCWACSSTGKVPSEKTGKPVICRNCNGTALDLKSATVPMTDPTPANPEGQVKTGRDTLVESGDEVLMHYAQYQEDDKILDTYCPFLEQGEVGVITLKANTPLATARTSFDGAVMLLPRQVSARLQVKLKGTGVVGVRDCIKPRDGYVFYSDDFRGGELVTHAESCFNLVGFSEMGKALNAGLDVHTAFGAQLMGVSYEHFQECLDGKHGKDKQKTAKLYRQAAKPPNFGFPGRMGPARLVIQQRESGPDTVWDDGPSDLGNDKRGYKGLRFCLLIGGAHKCGEVKVTEWNRQPTPPLCKLCCEVGSYLHKQWKNKWPENAPYFKHIQQLIDSGKPQVQHYSKRLRGGIQGNDAANGYFQAFLADITTRAQIRVAYEQYVDCGTVLYGSRGIAAFHDELFGEARLDVAPEVAERVSDIMVEEFQLGCPNHAAACKAEPTLMSRWYKEAECVRDANGRLMVWQPKSN